jgi:hypothetical protein
VTASPGNMVRGGRERSWGLPSRARWPQGTARADILSSHAPYARLSAPSSASRPLRPSIAAASWRMASPSFRPAESEEEREPCYHGRSDEVRALDGPRCPRGRPPRDWTYLSSRRDRLGDRRATRLRRDVRPLLSPWDDAARLPRGQRHRLAVRLPAATHGPSIATTLAARPPHAWHPPDVRDVRPQGRRSAPASGRAGRPQPALRSGPRHAVAGDRGGERWRAPRCGGGPGHAAGSGRPGLGAAQRPSSSPAAPGAIANDIRADACDHAAPVEHPAAAWPRSGDGSVGPSRRRQHGLVDGDPRPPEPRRPRRPRGLTGP